MKPETDADAGCRLLAKYVDEGEVPTGLNTRAGEAVRPRLTVEHLGIGSRLPEARDQVLQTLLEAVRCETHGPSRARMVEALVRLEAVRAVREACVRSPERSGDLCSRIADLFSPGLRTRLQERAE